MLIRDDGTTLGTVGGGPVELYVIEQAKEAIRERKNRTCDYTLIMKENEGMHCGGELSFFIDVEIPGSSLLLVGAGHVNQAVAKLALLSGFTVKVVDDREALLKKELYPPSVELFYGENLEEAVNKSEISQGSFVLVATGSEDSEGLKAVRNIQPFFLAMLGSRRKALMIKKGLKEENWSDEEINRIICPAGLDIGAETPSEIAISMISQMIMHRTGSEGKELYNQDYLKNLIIIRGAGDIATGTIMRLKNSGYPVLALETAEPTVIRRTVACAEAVRSGETEIEGNKAILASNSDEIKRIIAEGHIPVAVDPSGKFIKELKPAAVIDAILAKKNLGTNRDMAPLTIALGPGFSAGDDVHYIVETCRGHYLGKIIEVGPALANTGIPGNISGFTEERIVRSPGEGKVDVLRDIGSIVKKDEVIARIGKSDVKATMDGMVRGMIRQDTIVPAGMKIGDIDPRGEQADYTTISDKANAIGGSVLEILIRNRILP